MLSVSILLYNCGCFLMLRNLQQRTLLTPLPTNSVGILQIGLLHDGITLMNQVKNWRESGSGRVSTVSQIY